ncbi:GIY-YIG nuclease family protein [Candidatus Curtissbacteria bacterium]|nr:GIY-YIG nuclease family protein [Candidatus Curtissbacteria bacterium]
MYYVYIVKCADGTYYTGRTNDLDRRLNNHNHSKSGAHYTKIRRPVELIYKEECISLSDSLKRELVIKKLTRKQKEELVGAKRISL